MPYEEGYFGNCPICHQTEGFRNVKNELTENWFSCAEHKLKWCVGTGLFSRPIATEEDNAYLEGFTEISTDETWHPPSQVAECLLQQIIYPLDEMKGSAWHGRQRGREGGSPERKV